MLALSKNFTHLCEFNFCQMCMVRVYWNSWRTFLRKICTKFKSFRHLTESFWNFWRKNIRSVVKTELYDSSATFSRKTLLKKNKCFNFFELARIIGLWAEGIQQDAKTTFYVIRETFWRKLFEKMLFLLNCFFPWAKNCGPSGRIFLTALPKPNSTWPEKHFGRKEL